MTPLDGPAAPTERKAVNAGQQDSPCWREHQSDDDKYGTERSRTGLNCAVSRRCWRQEVRRWVACQKGMVLTAGCERRGGITWRRLSMSASWPASNLVTGRQYCSSEGDCCPVINSNPSKISKQQVCTPTASNGFSTPLKSGPNNMASRQQSGASHWWRALRASRKEQ